VPQSAADAAACRGSAHTATLTWTRAPDCGTKPTEAVRAAPAEPPPAQLARAPAHRRCVPQRSYDLVAAPHHQTAPAPEPRAGRLRAGGRAAATAARSPKPAPRSWGQGTRPRGARWECRRHPRHTPHGRACGGCRPAAPGRPSAPRAARSRASLSTSGTGTRAGRARTHTEAPAVAADGPARGQAHAASAACPKAEACERALAKTKAARGYGEAPDSPR